MTIIFTKQNTNYHQQNIIDLLNSINDPVIQEAIVNNKKQVKILGDIHRTQFLSDNPENYFWLRISVLDENQLPIIGYSGVHIFLCFRLFKYRKGLYIRGKCINPPTLNNTDIADVSKLFGGWEFRKITYSFQQSIKQIIDKKEYNLPKRKRIAIKIIDPKTGKEII